MAYIQFYTTTIVLCNIILIFAVSQEIGMMFSRNFNSIAELLQAFPDEQACIEHLEKLRWGKKIISPFDVDSVVYICKNNKYRCKNTGKYFNVKTNTIFDGTKIELRKWFVAIWLVSQNRDINSSQLALDVDITQKTAWVMLQRIKLILNIE